VSERNVLKVVDAFYRSFLAGDRNALAEVVVPKAAWIVPLDSIVSGAHTGPDGIVALRRMLHELTSGTWRPLRDDSVDIATSQWHGVIMDRFQAERGERRLDSHEAVIVAVEQDRIVRIFHYLHNPAGFAAFWSR
jgi:ketosteroid isomerase-like protein